MELFFFLLLFLEPSWAQPLAGRICHVAPEKQAKHISTLRRMLKASDPADIKLWMKSGKIQCWRNCIPCATTSTRTPSNSSCLTRAKSARRVSAPYSRGTVWHFLWITELSKLFFKKNIVTLQNKGK